MDNRKLEKADLQERKFFLMKIKVFILLAK